MRHKLTIEKTSYGHWGECSCDWSTGPRSTKADVRHDHDAHVEQREAAR